MKYERQGHFILRDDTSGRTRSSTLAGSVARGRSWRDDWTYQSSIYSQRFGEVGLGKTRSSRLLPWSSYERPSTTPSVYDLDQMAGKRWVNDLKPSSLKIVDKSAFASVQKGLSCESESDLLRTRRNCSTRLIDSR